MYPALAFLLALGLAGCGGGGGGVKTESNRTVRGDGFSFSAPTDWEVRTSPISILVAPRGDEVTLIGAYSLRTVKFYRPALWPRAAAELNRKATVLAVRLHGRVVSSTTTTVAHSRARQYVFSYTGKRARIIFFYRRRRQYELYCRWSASQTEPTACSSLARSFTPA